MVHTLLYSRFRVRVCYSSSKAWRLHDDRLCCHCGAARGTGAAAHRWLPLDCYVRLAVQNGVSRHHLESCTRFLHDTCVLKYFADYAALARCAGDEAEEEEQERESNIREPRRMNQDSVRVGCSNALRQTVKGERGQDGATRDKRPGGVNVNKIKSYSPVCIDIEWLIESVSGLVRLDRRELHSFFTSVDEHGEVNVEGTRKHTSAYEAAMRDQARAREAVNELAQQLSDVESKEREERESDSALRYALYLLYWYRSTHTDASVGRIERCAPAPVLSRGLLLSIYISRLQEKSVRRRKRALIRCNAYALCSRSERRRWPQQSARVKRPSARMMSGYAVTFGAQFTCFTRHKSTHTDAEGAGRLRRLEQFTSHGILDVELVPFLWRGGNSNLSRHFWHSVGLVKVGGVSRSGGCVGSGAQGARGSQGGRGAEGDADVLGEEQVEDHTAILTILKDLAFLYAITPSITAPPTHTPPASASSTNSVFMQASESACEFVSVPFLYSTSARGSGGPVCSYRTPMEQYGAVEKTYRFMFSGGIPDGFVERLLASCCRCYSHLKLIGGRRNQGGTHEGGEGECGPCRGGILWHYGLMAHIYLHTGEGGGHALGGGGASEVGGSWEENGAKAGLQADVEAWQGSVWWVVCKTSTQRQQDGIYLIYQSIYLYIHIHIYHTYI